MSTLLSKTSVPLYVWIIVIVVCSLVILGTIAFLVRLIVVRQRRAAFADTFGDDNLTRRVTVRRGRVVEQSKYLSLTGSRFGLNAFGTEDDLQSRAGARSKSPFEWWSTVKERSQSQNSQVTQIKDDASSIYGPASPGPQRIYQRRDLNYSTTSLSSVTKEDDVSVSVVEEEPMSPPPLVRNFSRSFSRQGQYTPRMRALSRIEESSPHTSMISTRQSRGTSYASHRRDTRTDSPSPTSHSPTQTTAFPQQPSYKKSSVYHDRSQPPNSKKSSLYVDKHESTLQTPLPVAYNGSRSSLGEPEPSRLSTVSSRNSLGSTKSRRQSQITALPEAPHPKQTEQYWDTRPDLHPVRTTSKKGKVLRKKSLTRRELVTRIDT